ncbi:unnamed protein product [Cuscuta epithymum]|uniref:Uncharacterized protein n=1 Tax=Cuscuta epithymum TaxID=186058 RepID=A0AAV0DJ93_9ASTE|nr:unnamed protein product [Cuscuta epithymum]
MIGGFLAILTKSKSARMSKLFSQNPLAEYQLEAKYSISEFHVKMHGPLSFSDWKARVRVLYSRLMHSGGVCPWRSTLRPTPSGKGVPHRQITFRSADTHSYIMIIRRHSIQQDRGRAQARVYFLEQIRTLITQETGGLVLGYIIPAYYCSGAQDIIQYGARAARSISAHSGPLWPLGPTSARLAH